MKREPEQSSFSSGEHPLLDVQKRLVLEDALYDDPNRPRLFHDEEMSGPIARMSEKERRLEPASDDRRKVE
jgi:hypothetical protein